MLAPAESAPLLLPAPGELTATPLHGALLTALGGGGGMFFRMLSDRVAAVLDGHPADDGDLVAAPWDPARAGLVSNDTLAPLRVASPHGAPVRRPAAPRRTSGSSLASDLGSPSRDRAWDSRGSDEGGAVAGPGTASGRARTAATVPLGSAGAGLGGSRGAEDLFPACSISPGPRRSSGFAAWATPCLAGPGRGPGGAPCRRGPGRPR